MHGLPRWGVQVPDACRTAREIGEEKADNPLLSKVGFGHDQGLVLPITILSLEVELLGLVEWKMLLRDQLQSWLDLGRNHRPDTVAADIKYPRNGCYFLSMLPLVSVMKEVICAGPVFRRAKCHAARICRLDVDGYNSADLHAPAIHRVAYWCEPDRQGVDVFIR